jgi:hypothetical protein
VTGGGAVQGGIVIKAAAVYVNCEVERFTRYGIHLDFSETALSLTDGIVRQNGAVGLRAFGSGAAKLKVDNSQFENNGVGLDDGVSVSSISRSIVFGNVGNGIVQRGGEMNVTSTTDADNGGNGYAVSGLVSGPGQMTLESSVARGNGSAGF